MVNQQGKWIASLCLLAVSIGLAGNVGWAAKDASSQAPSQEAEAQEFFRQLASHARNPLIASLAAQNVSKLQQKASSSHSSGNLSGASAGRQVVVPLMEQPDTSLVVPLLINSKVMATFLVDTGSSYTVITPALAKRLGVEVTPDTPKVTLITANGTVEAPMATLHNVSLGPVKVAEVGVVIQQLGNGDDTLLSGLLGMNFFKGMDLTLKGDRLVIGLHQQD